MHWFSGQDKVDKYVSAWSFARYYLFIYLSLDPNWMKNLELWNLSCKLWLTTIYNYTPSLLQYYTLHILAQNYT